jgi:hypothetical protein
VRRPGPDTIPAFDRSFRLQREIQYHKQRHPAHSRSRIPKAHARSRLLLDVTLRRNAGVKSTRTPRHWRPNRGS